MSSVKMKSLRVTSDWIWSNLIGVRETKGERVEKQGGKYKEYKKKKKKKIPWYSLMEQKHKSTIQR